MQDATRRVATSSETGSLPGSDHADRLLESEKTSSEHSAPGGMGEIVALDAVTLMEKIHTHALSCAEVMEAYLVRIAQCNPQHNALVAMKDASELFDDARHLDRAGKSNDEMGMLHGFPQAPKDLLPVAGMPSTRGSRVFKDLVPDTDAPTFARMRKAGALFVARTNTPEFGLGGHTYNPVYGVTRNAFTPALSAGGSSGGAAVAVALHMLPVADGSDMMGSLRTPAAFNGIYGLRTTPGLIPNGDQSVLVQPALSVAGPMARNLPDLALLLSVMADFPAALPFERKAKSSGFLNPLLRDFRGANVAWLGDINGYLPFEMGVLDACNEGVSLFEDIGCRVESYVPPFDYGALWQSWIDLRSALFFKSNAGTLDVDNHFSLIKPEAQWEFERGRRLDTIQIDAALRVRAQWRDALDKAFGQFEFLLLPSAQVFPFPVEQHWPDAIGGRSMDTYHRWMEVVIPAAMGGTPALSIPAGDPQHGRGAGIQIIARAQAELAVMQLGHAYDLARKACGK